MSKEFVKARINLASITKAANQQNELAYFITSKIENYKFSSEYLDSWAQIKYSADDCFLNWVKSLFKDENFIAFYKYLRFPLPSAKLIHDKIEPQLMRVFNSEDAAFRYDVTGKEESDFIQGLNPKQFNQDIFREFLYYHNSIYITDMDNEVVNKPYGYYVDINNVVSIEVKNNKIIRIAYRASVNYEGKVIKGYVYIDKDQYQFIDNDYNEIISSPHDLGYTPAHFIAPSNFDKDPIIKESIFTYVREELEEFVFLKTLLKMTEPNGAIPITTILDVERELDTRDLVAQDLPISANDIQSTATEDILTKKTNKGESLLQAGTINKVPLEAIRNDDGSINMAAVTNYLNFFYIPVDILKYINEKIEALKISIISTVVGDHLESKEAAKNELQIEKSLSVLENTLFSLSETFNRIRKLRDTDYLNLMYGKDRVNNIFIHYGTDFFLDSQTKLFEDLEKAPNSLERKNIIVRINNNKYKNNIEALGRQKILYDLIPYVSDKDFDKAIETQIIDDVIKSYQLRFSYWISQFEALYGDIVNFYNNIESDNATKLTQINTLIIGLIPIQEKKQEIKQEIET